MAIEQPRNVPLTPLAAPTPAADASADIRQTESSLNRVEELVDAAMGRETDLGEATWQLTLAQWNLGLRDSFRRQWPRQTAMAIASAAVVAYLIYRLFWTLNLSSAPAGIFSCVLFAAEAYAGFSLGLYFFQVWRLVEPPARRPAAQRTVDVFVTTYNEDVSLLRGTLNACLDMDYPHTTYVLDDGARDEVRRLAEELGVRYISRTDRAHAKAGNINNAMRQTDGEFVIVLDADHLPYRQFIMRLIGYFDDPRMGFVQVPHTTYNLDNFMGRWATASKAYWEDIRIFFEAVQLGKNRHEVACFCGSAAIFRRRAIEDVGLFATETITEDMHTGMRINAAGWKSIAVSEEMVVGLAPDDAATFASQRLRWGEGNLSVMAYDNPLTMKGLTLAGRINYFASIASWTMGPARLILYLTPLVMLLTGIAPVADMSLAYFAVVGCYLVTVWTAVKMASNGCGQLIGIEMAMMASFHLQLKALWRAVFGRRRQKFVVTRKRRSQGLTFSGWRLMWPQAALVALSIVAVSWAAARVLFWMSADYFGLLIGSGLAMYHSWLALCVLGRATAKRNADEQWRHPICLAADYSIGGENRPAVSVEFNENGCRLLTWKPLERGRTVSITFHSPVGQTTCMGRAASSMPVNRAKPFAHLSNIVFEQADPSLRERESDALRGIILKYVVPVVTMTHRTVHQGARSLPEELSGENEFPIPVSINPNQPNMGVQRSVALLLNQRGFLAVLPVSCAVGSVVQATLDTPFGPLVAEADVREVETMRVGATIVHQHEFHWRDPSAVRRAVSPGKRWKTAFLQTTAQMREHRQSTAAMVLMTLAGYMIAIATVLVFSQTHRADILLANASDGEITPAQEEKVQTTLGRVSESASASTDQLLRAYKAAAATGNDTVAAAMADRLADRVKAEKFDWLLTAARHLARANDLQAANAAFDRLAADPTKAALPLDRQAEIYVEAARAAVAVKNLDKAVERFLQASNLRAADPKQAEELLGVLIAAKQTRLAIQVLRQLDRSDKVLRRIVDVYEIAEEPEKARPELEELYRRHPDDAGVILRLAELAVERRDFTAGVEYYKVLRKLEPGNEKATQILAEIWEMQGEREKALQLLLELEKHPPVNQRTKQSIARLLLANRQYDDAAVRLMELLKDAPNDRRLQREFTDAVAAAERLNDEMRRAMLEIYGHYRVEDFAALDKVGFERLGDALRRLGMFEEARTTLDRAIERYPKTRRLRFYLADTLTNLGRYDDAETQYKILLDARRTKN